MLSLGCSRFNIGCRWAQTRPDGIDLPPVQQSAASAPMNSLLRSVGADLSSKAKHHVQPLRLKRRCALGACACPRMLQWHNSAACRTELHDGLLHQLGTLSGLSSWS